MLLHCATPYQIPKAIAHLCSHYICRVLLFLSTALTSDDCVLFAQESSESPPLLLHQLLLRVHLSHPQLPVSEFLGVAISRLQSLKSVEENPVASSTSKEDHSACIYSLVQHFDNLHQN